MSDRTNVYKMTLLVIDHDRMGEEETREVIEHHRYLFASVMDVQTAEVEWSDDHPLNTGQRAQAFADLFGLQSPQPTTHGVAGVQHPPASADSQQQGDDGEDV